LPNRSSILVTYNYANGRLSSINAKDGRQVAVEWHPTIPAIQKITLQPASATARSWIYSYYQADNFAFLTSVQLPDLSMWTFAGAQNLDVALSDANLGKCDTRSETDLAASPTVVHTTTVTSPSGATGTFKRRGQWHARTYVPSACVYDAYGGGYYEGVPQLFGTYSLLERTISGPGLTPRTWSYDYPVASGSALRDSCAQDATCAETAHVVVTDPNGDRVKYTYFNRWGATEGKLTKVEAFDGATLVRTEDTAYADANNGPYPSRLGDGLTSETSNWAKSETLAPVVKRVTTQGGRKFIWEVAKTANGYAFDYFGRPLTFIRSSVEAP
jgi:hypothetical protein